MPSSLLYKLRSLTVYRHLLEKPVLHALCELLTADDAVTLCDRYGAFCAALNTTPAPHSLAHAIAADILTDDNPFSSACSADRRPDTALFAAAKRDLSILCEASRFTLDDLLQAVSFDDLPALSSWNVDPPSAPLDSDDWGLQVEDIAAYHARYGCG